MFIVKESDLKVWFELLPLAPVPPPLPFKCWFSIVMGDEFGLKSGDPPP